PPPPNRRADEPEPKRASGMPEHKVPCFNVSDKHLDRIPEFDRQLAGQEKGLNDLTVEEYLKGREAFKNGEALRDPIVAANARKLLGGRMEDQLLDKLIGENVPPEQALILAKKMTEQKMATLAALHNPDLVAGGRDVINDLGDRRINSSIGPQWQSRIGSLDTAASQVPAAIQNITKINAKLERCK
ncbi:polymorphic toxin type 15 domain-containing protein, partial [Pseudomonas syringae]